MLWGWDGPLKGEKQHDTGMEWIGLDHDIDQAKPNMKHIYIIYQRDWDWGEYYYYYYYYYIIIVSTIAIAIAIIIAITITILLLLSLLLLLVSVCNMIDIIVRIKIR